MLQVRSSIPAFVVRLRDYKLHGKRSFHQTGPRRAENYYRTLGLEPDASPGAIKKKFYSLSKTHHPDHNPGDLHASERFVKISVAYATIGNPEKRKIYDRHVIRAHDASSHSTPQGSHSSASAPFGSRPASGLSRRRTQFKGPPPSFYSNGGWGSHGARRKSQARGTSAASDPAVDTSGGFPAWQAQGGYSNDVPHFDHEGHYRTQQSQEQRWRRRNQDDFVYYSTGGADVALKFVLIGGIVGLAFVPWWAFGLGQQTSPRRRRDRSAEG